MNDPFYESRAWLELRYSALKKSNGCCQCCGERATRTKPLHVDHIKPRSKHPELELTSDNLQVLCAACNYGKSNIDSTDWRSASWPKITARPEYLIPRKHLSKCGHIWIGDDTACRMASTGGLSPEKYLIAGSLRDHTLCAMCIDSRRATHHQTDLQ